MRRPSRPQLVRRRAGAAVAAVLALGLGAAVVARDRGDPPAAPPPSTAATGAAPTATAVEPTTTTTPTGRFTGATVDGPVVGAGRVVTYRVETEDGSGVDAEGFGNRVEEILSDPRGWTTADGISLQRVAGAAEITVTLATPPTVDLLCFPLDTDGTVSCAKEGRAIINLERWLSGAGPSGLTLADYRRYLVSHEVGHRLRFEPCALSAAGRHIPHKVGGGSPGALGGPPERRSSIGP